MISKHHCSPVFSEPDSDLRLLKWRLNPMGYPRRGKYIKGRVIEFRAHRVVMERVVGRPLTSGDIIDHINGNKLDNRRNNLRITDYFGNAQNRRCKNGAYRGATFHRQCGRWQAQVKHNGRLIYLGLFDTREEASASARLKREELAFLV